MEKKMTREPQLLIVSSLTVARQRETVWLTKKFISGVLEHQAHWPGPVLVLMEPASDLTDNLDNATYQQADLPFQLIVSRFNDPAVEEFIADASLVMLLLYQRHTPIAKICVHKSVPFTLTSEYTLRTRLQIIDAADMGKAKALAKRALEWLRESSFVKAVRSAAGLQCNGTPTFKAYRSLNNNTMLFFDTRVKASSLANIEHLALRFSSRRQGKMLRLGFTGRLIPMKGALDLIDVAVALRDMGFPFTLSICGDGSALSEMKRRVQAFALHDEVIFKGNLDFESELLPFVRDHIDVFVCCHVQGDPSCTYLETMSFGVPIAGYANEAFEGLVQICGAGWVGPMSNPSQLAHIIAGLNEATIELESRKSLDFAAAHTVELEFERRTANARRAAGLV